MTFLLYLCHCLVVILFVSLPLSRAQTCQTECQSIGTLQQCGYNCTGHNSTVYPSPVVNNVAQVTSLLPIIQSAALTGCSPNLQRFICSALLPECRQWMGPCRNLCEIVRTDCYSRLSDSQRIILKSLFTCERYRNDTQCVVPISPSPSQTPTPSPSPSSSSLSPSPTPPTNALNSNETGCPPPSLTYYTQSSKTFATGWISTWATFCFLSTLLTLLTFIIKPSRFEYPWRPIVYLALCFNIHSLGYYFSLILGRNIITCPGNVYASSTAKWGWAHIPCLFNFGLLYYSMVAAFLWWLTLTISWFLSSVFKWSNEAVGHLAPFFHVAAWVFPLLMTISLVAAQVVSADELTGTCFIVRDATPPTLYALLIGVLVPLMLFVLTGLIFLIIGLISVLRVRAFLHRKGRQRESIVLEKLVVRVGVFVGVYVIPAGVVIGCYFYELITTPNWSTIEESLSCAGQCNTANPIIPMVRIFMFLMIGSLTGVWIWSKKTFESWRSLGDRCNSCIPASPEKAADSSSSTFNS